MKELRIIVATLALLSVVTVSAHADEVHMTDGSKIVGTIKQMTTESIVIETKFAGELTIKAENVAGFSSDRKMVVSLGTGDRVVGTPQYTAEGQKITGTNFGDVAVKPDTKVTGAWTVGDAPVSASVTMSSASYQ